MIPVPPVKQIDPRKLKPWPKQARRIAEEELQSLCTSIREFGFLQPVVVQASSGRVIGGHQRIKAAILEELPTVPAVFIEITDSRAAALNLALNRIGGEFDYELLPEMLAQVAQDDRQLTGFQEQELEDLLDVKLEDEAKIEEMSLKPPPKVIWVLLGIPIDDFGSVQEHLAAIEKSAAVTIQTTR